MFFAASGLMASFGFFVFEKGQSKRLFLTASLGLLLSTFWLLFADIVQNRPVLHLIPEEYHGTVEIITG